MSVERSAMGNAGEYEREWGDEEGGNTAMDMAIVSATTKAELDQQIVTARANPRSLRRFVTECMDMACLSESVASECYYVLPRGGKNIEGPSVRLAEIVQYAWGNCQSGSRVIDEGDEFITAQGAFYDLEKNVKIMSEVRVRIVDKHGKRFNIDMIGVTGNAACSKAVRNAIFRGIPKAFWNDIYLAARKTAAGNVKSLVTNRTEALNYLSRKGVTEAVVIAALGVAGIEDIGLDELSTLRGMVTAIKDEGVAVETAFAPKDAPVGKPHTTPPKAKPKIEVEPEPVTTSARTTDSVATITAIQHKKLTAKALAEGVDVQDLCAHFKVAALDELSAYHYANAYTWLSTATEAAHG